MPNGSEEIKYDIMQDAVPERTDGTGGLRSLGPTSTAEGHQQHYMGHKHGKMRTLISVIVM